MIARDLQRARNTRIIDGQNEPGVGHEVRSNGGRSQSPLRSALKHQSQGPVRRDLTESFGAAGGASSIKLE